MTTPESLPTLIVQIEGSVRKSTVDAFRTAAMEYVDSISTVLENDNDFAEAEDVSKWCKQAEKQIKAAKDQAVNQAADINALFETLDDIAEAIRQKRLSLDRQVKAQKAERKQEAIDKAMADLRAHVDDLETSLDGLRLPDPSRYLEDFTDATKRRTTLRTLRDAVDAALQVAKDDYQDSYQVAFTNVATLRNHEEHRFLFADAQNYIDKAPDDFANLLKVRIAEHKESEKARLEAEREKIRQEERLTARAGGDVPDVPEVTTPPPATFEEKMQTIMFAFVTLIDRMGREEFLGTCGLSDGDYEEIRRAWRDNLGVEL